MKPAPLLALVAALGGCSPPALLSEPASETTLAVESGQPVVGRSELKTIDLGDVTGSVPTRAAPSAEAVRDTALGSTTNPVQSVASPQSVVVTLPPSISGVPGGIPSTFPPPPVPSPSPPPPVPSGGGGGFTPAPGAGAGAGVGANL